MGNVWLALRRSLNFYRIHLICFTLTPLIFSAIFYASNGQFQIAYIDALFNCVSAMTVTGLATVNLSTLTGWQQALLFLLQCMGSPVLVSWVMVYIRRIYFTKHLKHLIERRALDAETRVNSGWTRTVSRIFTRQSVDAKPEDDINKKRAFFKKNSLFKKGPLKHLRTDMIKRLNDAPKPVDPSGWVTPAGIVSPQKESFVEEKGGSSHEPHLGNGNRDFDDGVATSHSSENDLHDENEVSNVSPEPTEHSLEPISEVDDELGSMQQRAPTVPLPENRTQTVDFRVPEIPERGRRRRRQTIGEADNRRSSIDTYDDRHHRHGLSIPYHRTSTMHTYRSERSAMERGYGGFPSPPDIFVQLLRRFFPKLQQRLNRTVTIPNTATYTSHGGNAVHVPYFSFDARIGRNSRFHGLTRENVEEIGGVEYRALNALLWIVAAYHLGIQLISFIVIAPYISTPRWRSDFEPPRLFRYVPPPWFAAFQVASSYTNAGMSLVDQSMVPFQKAYPMIFFMVFCILAGNTAFPVFLRFFIWVITKFVNKASRSNETLRFLLDHPRRCFIYLFPSHQTWFLFTVVLLLNATDWFFFLVLDIGNPEIERVPLGTRFAIGLLQATAVRAAGFGTVSLSALAPGVQVLYVMMMYISVYPIALSVRSTNVYEERSLGVFEEEEEKEPSGDGSRVAVWGKYLSWHARKQLAFDMWWLGLALFFVCIIERSKLENQDNFSWFTIFTIVFELISAYGTVGLSLGIPGQNYSFSGALSPLSKLIVCAVMIRGRHRGLPVAIDRATLLPNEYKAAGIESDGSSIDGGTHPENRQQSP